MAERSKKQQPLTSDSSEGELVAKKPTKKQDQQDVAGEEP